MRVAFLYILGACYITQVYAEHNRRMHGIHALVCDILDFHSNLFSRDSLNIVGVCVPVYMLARQGDYKLQSYFYDRKKHKNTCQVPLWCTICADVGILAVPMLLAGARAFCSGYTQVRVPAQVFLMSLPFTWVTKRILKLFTWDCCLRPPRQECTRNRSVYGGFPSGHMFEVVYMAALFGNTYGRRWGTALTGGALFLGASFIACNRHYLSQLIAGATLGFIYAYAARKLIHKKLALAKVAISGTIFEFSYLF